MLVVFVVFLVEFSGDVRAILSVRGVCAGRLSDGCVGFGGLVVSLCIFMGEIWQPFRVVGVEALLGDKTLYRRKEHK